MTEQDGAHREHVHIETDLDAVTGFEEDDAPDGLVGEEVAAPRELLDVLEKGDG